MKFQISYTQEQIDLHKLGQKYLSLYWSSEDSNIAEHFKQMCFVVINVLSEQSHLTNNGNKSNR